MNIRKAFIFFILLFVSINVHSQLSASGYNSDDMEAFFKTKTFYVKSGNARFDSLAIAGLEKYWKQTKYDTMSHENFEKNISNPAYSFMMLIQIEVITEKKDQNGLVVSRYSDYYHYFGIFCGGKKKIEKYVYSDMVAYCPLNFRMNEKPMAASAFRVQPMIHNLNEAITIVKEKQFRGNSLKMVNQFKDFYMSRSKILKEKTLLVDTDLLVDITKDEFDKAYPFKVEFCNREKIEKALADKDEKYLIYQPGVTMNKSVMVFDASTYDCVFFNTDMKLKIKKDDIEDMVKVANSR